MRSLPWQGPGEESCLEVTLHLESIMALLTTVSLAAMLSAAITANNFETKFHLAGHGFS